MAAGKLPPAYPALTNPVPLSQTMGTLIGVCGGGVKESRWNRQMRDLLRPERLSHSGTNEHSDCEEHSMMSLPWNQDLITDEQQLPRIVCFYLSQGVNLLGSLGNKDVFLMLGNPQNNMTTRSSPTPAPPCGGAPYLKALTYDLMVFTGISLAMALSTNSSGS